MNFRYLVTGPRAQAKHVQFDGTHLCPRTDATTEATGRFADLPTCKSCSRRFLEIAEDRATAREEAAAETATEEQATAPGVRVTLVYTGDRDPAVHRPGCSHVKREKTRSGGHTETLTVTSREQIVRHVYADIMSEDPELTADSLYGCLNWVSCVNDVLGHDVEPVEVSDGESATEEAIQIHFSARVARYLSKALQEELPDIAGDLAAARHKRRGTGYTALVCTNLSRAAQLLELMQKMADDMNNGVIKPSSTGFRAEAVEKGVQHVSSDMWSALAPA